MEFSLDIVPVLLSRVIFKVGRRLLVAALRFRDPTTCTVFQSFDSSPSPEQVEIWISVGCSADNVPVLLMEVTFKITCWLLVRSVQRWQRVGRRGSPRGHFNPKSHRTHRLDDNHR